MNATADAPALLLAEDLQITQAAHDKFISLLKDVDEPGGVRVYVTGGGCSGMTYGLTFTNEVTQFDHVREDNGLTMVVDAVALNYLRGAQIDFVEQGMGASFVFRNVFQATGGSGGCSSCGSGGGCA